MKVIARALLCVPLFIASAVTAEDQLDAIRVVATQGDYEAQRTLASCLGAEESECSLRPAPDLVEACAWRMIILTSEHARVGEDDVAAYKRDCGFQAISQLEQVTALARAERLFRDIYHREMQVGLLLR